MKKTTFFKFATIAFVLLNVIIVKAQETIAVIQEPFVILINPEDGSIVDPEFIDLTPLNQATPKAIIQVDDEIWVSDQIEDAIFRFDIDGNFLSSISSGLDNIKGMAVVDDTEVWVTNAGSNNDAPGNSIVRFDIDGTNLGFYDTSSVGSAFDIIDTGTEVYIGYIGANSKIEVRDYNGIITGEIVATGVVSFIQQIELNTSDNSIYAAVFSSLGSNTSGLYEFSIADGSILNYYNEGSLRGVAQLDDGNVLISGGNDISLLNTTTNASTVISSGGSSQFFTRLDFTACSTPDTPTGASTQTFEEGATLAEIVINPTDVAWFATETDATNNTNPLPLNTVLVDGVTYYAVNIVEGCLSEPFAITVIITLGINDLNEFGIRYFPNPTSGLLTIEHTHNITKISVSNLFGQNMYVLNTNKSKIALDMSNLANGIYLVSVTSNARENTYKILKN